GSRDRHRVGPALLLRCRGTSDGPVTSARERVGVSNSDDPQATAATGSPAHRYGAELAARIEPWWQEEWAAKGTFHAPNPVGERADDDPVPGEKLFVQDMFPYPSGSGLHVGHPLGYIATDVFARFHRMLGRNVLHTLGYDSFGLPAEQYA